ncbi:MAG: HAD family hydrolase [Thermoleophilaceae bacterium]
MRGLIVDFGGVLTTDVFQAFREFGENEGIDPGTVKRLFKEDEKARTLLRELERGEVEEGEFERRFAPMLGVSDSEGLIKRLFAGVHPDEPMLAAVETARGAGVRTGLISNSWGNGVTYRRERFDRLFDAVVISGEVGLNKPAPEIFRLGAERVGVVPEDCVFVDDLRENCEGAEAVGMTAVLHRGAEGTLPELERLLGVPLG